MGACPQSDEVELTMPDIQTDRKTCVRAAYPWVQNDGGRSMSHRPKQKDDCTVRAMAITLARPYDMVYDMLAAAGRQCNWRFRIDDWLNVQPFARRFAFPAVKVERRMNPVAFCEAHPSGRYICRVAKHVFAVVDGVVHDAFENRSDRCIYTAWKIEKEEVE